MMFRIDEDNVANEDDVELGEIPAFRSNDAMNYMSSSNLDLNDLNEFQSAPNFNSAFGMPGD